jgi:hypothetical protein
MPEEQAFSFFDGRRFHGNSEEPEQDGDGDGDKPCSHGGRPSRRAMPWTLCEEIALNRRHALLAALDFACTISSAFRRAWHGSHISPIPRFSTNWHGGSDSPFPE